MLGSAIRQIRVQHTSSFLLALQVFRILSEHEAALKAEIVLRMEDINDRGLAYVEQYFESPCSFQCVCYIDYANNLTNRDERDGVSIAYSLRPVIVLKAL